MIIIESIESLKMSFTFSSFFQQFVINVLPTAASFYAFTDLRAIKIRQSSKHGYPRFASTHKRELIVDVVIDTIYNRHSELLHDLSVASNNN